MEGKTPPMGAYFPTGKYMCFNERMQDLKTFITEEAKTQQNNEELVVVRYWMLCGDPRSNEPLKSFTFLEAVPRIICKPIDPYSVKFGQDLLDLPEAYQNSLGLAKDLFQKYTDEVKISRPWFCVMCKKPAAAFRSSSYFSLAPEPGSDSQGFTPMILSVAVPVCPRSENAGACSDPSYFIAQEYGRKIMAADLWRNWDLMRVCQKCGSTANIKICGGCKLMGYCSKECQSQSWASHKATCKLAKKDKEIKWNT